MCSSLDTGELSWRDGFSPRLAVPFAERLGGWVFAIVKDIFFDLAGRNPHNVDGVTYDPHTIALTSAIRSYKIKEPISYSLCLCQRARPRRQHIRPIASSAIYRESTAALLCCAALWQWPVWSRPPLSRRTRPSAIVLTLEARGRIRMRTGSDGADDGQGG
jgi:hypothetical protein